MNIEKLRIEHNLKKKDVAQIIGISPSAYGRYESNCRQLPLKHAIKLAEFYGIDKNYIFDLNEDMKTQISVNLSYPENSSTNVCVQIIDTSNKLNTVNKEILSRLFEMVISTLIKKESPNEITKEDLEKAIKNLKSN